MKYGSSRILPECWQSPCRDGRGTRNRLGALGLDIGADPGSPSVDGLRGFQNLSWDVRQADLIVLAKYNSPFDHIA